MSDEVVEISVAELWKHPAMGPIDIDSGALGPGPHTPLQCEAWNHYFYLDWVLNIPDADREVIESAYSAGQKIPADVLRRCNETLDGRIFVMARVEGKPFIGYCHAYNARIREWIISDVDGDRKFARLGKALSHNKLVRQGKAKGEIQDPQARIFKDRAVKELEPLLLSTQRLIAQDDSLPRYGNLAAFSKIWPNIESAVKGHPKDFVLLNARLSHLKNFLHSKADAGELYRYLRDMSAEQFVTEWMPFGSNQSVEYYRQRVSRMGKALVCAKARL